MLLILSMIVPGIVQSHGDQDNIQTANIDTFTVVNGDTIAVNGKSIESENETKAENEKPFVLDITKELTDHLHNKIVHFPIALGTLAFILTLLNFKEKKFDKAILITVALGFIFSMVAFFTGLNQAEPFEGTGKEWLVNIHMYFGLSLFFMYFVWLVFLIIDQIKKYSWIIGSIVFVLILITGFLGGVIAH